MPDYIVSLVARVPAPFAAPTLTEVDRLVASSFTFVDELNRPGSATFNVNLGTLSTAVKTRFANLALFPSEVWVYRNSVKLWAGEVRTTQIQDQTLTISCAGLLGYTMRMVLNADLVYSGVDQFQIARGLIDFFQSDAYGNYGLVTSGIGTSGVTRDRSYLFAEQHVIGTRIMELGAVNNGFDIAVDPTSRAVQLSYPQRGTDLSASLFMDRLNIASASVSSSVAPDDLVTDVLAIGTGTDADGTQVSISSMQTNIGLQASYGRSGASQSFDGVIVQATLDGSATGYLNARNGQFFQPGLTLIPRVGFAPGDVKTGDSVSYAYDAGLGMQSGVFRIGKLAVSVSESNEERMSVEFT